MATTISTGVGDGRCGCPGRGLGSSKADRPTYEATTPLVVGFLAGDSDTVQAAGQRARTYAEVVESEPLLDEAAETLGLPLDEVSAEVDATGDEVTRLEVVTVRDHDADRATDLANALVDALERQAAEQRDWP